MGSAQRAKPLTARHRRLPEFRLIYPNEVSPANSYRRRVEHMLADDIGISCNFVFPECVGKHQFQLPQARRVLQRVSERYTSK